MADSSNFGLEKQELERQAMSFSRDLEKQFDSKDEREDNSLSVLEVYLLVLRAFALLASPFVLMYVLILFAEWIWTYVLGFEGYM
jgi:hypothetical protein